MGKAALNIPDFNVQLGVGHGKLVAAFSVQREARRFGLGLAPPAYRWWTQPSLQFLDLHVHVQEIEAPSPALTALTALAAFN